LCTSEEKEIQKKKTGEKPFHNHHGKYAQHSWNEFHRWLSIRGKETISSLAQHTRKCLKVEYLGRIEYDFQKSRITGS
jgi:hypothetical protein